MGNPMRAFILCVLAIVTIGGLANAADEVRVEIVLSTTSGCSGGSTTYFYDAGEAISITGLAPCARRINIYAIPNTSDVGPVSISGTGSSHIPSQLDIVIGSGAFPGGSQTTTACGDFGGLTISDSTLRNKTHLAGHIGGNLDGSITVNTLYRLDVEGSINQPITATNAASGSCLIVAGSIGDSGDITLSNTLVTLVDVAGNCAGDLLAPNGGFNTILIGGNLTGTVRSANSYIRTLAVDGDIGAPGSPVSIQAMDDVAEIIADQIHANIDARYNSGNGSLYRLETRGGDLTGSLSARFLTTSASVDDERIQVAGNLTASITLSEDLRIPIHADGNITGNFSTTNDLHAPTSSTGSAGTITAGGNITGSISITGSMEATTFGHSLISAAGDITGAITIGGAMQSATGHQATIETTTSGGDLTNNITVTGAANGKIEIDGSFTAGTIDLNSTFGGTIAVGGSITGGTIDVSGDASGAITVGNDIEAAGSIIIRGSANANITVTDDMGGLINIGGSLNTGKTIVAQSLMLGLSPGHVIINSLNSTGAWNGDVTINSVTLSPEPLYANTGLGGSVGLPEFALHGDDCTPADEGTTPPGETWIFVRLYGPVTWDENEDMPFLIEYRTTGGSNWTDDTANWFVHSGKGTRTIQLGYQDGITDPSPIPAERDYRIRPIRTGDAALLCDKLLTTTPTLVEDFTYYFYTP